VSGSGSSLRAHSIAGLSSYLWTRGRVTSSWSKKREVNAAPRELQMIRIIIAHHPETIAAADRVVRLESGQVLGSEAAEPSLLGAAA
jgi:hypothetical protein